MGWGARTHEGCGKKNPTVDMSTKARLFSRFRPGWHGKIGSQSYDVDKNGSLRRSKPSRTVTKAA